MGDRDTSPNHARRCAPTHVEAGARVEIELLRALAAAGIEWQQTFSIANREQRKLAEHHARAVLVHAIKRVDAWRRSQR